VRHRRLLLAAYNYLSDPKHYQLDREQKIKLASDTLLASN
jgi:hypothetical protein